MEQVMKHYGNAILAVIVLLALGAIIVAAVVCFVRKHKKEASL